LMVMGIQPALITDVHSQIAVTPNHDEIPVKLGDEVELVCSSEFEALGCSFRSPDQTAYNLIKGAKYEQGRVGQSETGNAKDCAMKITDIKESDIGEWECTITAKGPNGDFESGNNKVQIILAPLPPETVELKIDGQSITDNKKVVGMYLDGWSKGNSSIIYEVLSDSYTFRCVGNPAGLVTKEGFKQYTAGFRSIVEKNGGPNANSAEFMKFKNVVQRKVGDGLITAGQFQVPDFASGTGLIFAKGGKIMWEECIRDSKNWSNNLQDALLYSPE